MDILKLLREHGVTATFFVVGELAERFPDLMGKIIGEGHEVAFHGWSHLPLWKLSHEVFREETKRFKGRVPECEGFRAPSFSLNNDTKWALKVLKDEGFRYDSSVFPSWTPLYGIYGAPLKPYYPSLMDISREGNEDYGILEFPLAIYNFFGVRFPIAGGFWLRIWDIDIVKRGIKKMNRSGLPAVIYVHNWELDTETPKLRLPILKNLVTYHNLTKTKEKLLSLIKDYKFTSFTDYLHEKII